MGCVENLYKHFHWQIVNHETIKDSISTVFNIISDSIRILPSLDIDASFCTETTVRFSFYRPLSSKVQQNYTILHGHKIFAK